ncbi:MAG: TraR/DksA family transcriptional regulator [Bacteroidota bacterium]
MIDQNVSATARYSDADLAEFQEIVEQKLEKAKEELSYLQEQILEITENSGDDHGGDWMDDSSTNNDIEFLNNMAIRQRKYIQDLENAVIRIKNKTYGMCLVTGHLIDKRRLLAVPTATKSVEAKKAEAVKEALKPAEKKTLAPLEVLEKMEKEEASQPKIITKVIRKPKSSTPAKPVNVEEDDDLVFDFDKEYAYDGADAETDTDEDYEKGGTTEQPDVFDDDQGGGGGGGRRDDYEDYD